MTVCDVCGGDQFTLEDGFFFCNECQTQSQDIREMVTDDMYATGATLVRSAVVSEKTLADRQRRREVRAEVRGVRQLLSHAEVLNELLRRWTTVLVARGAPAQLPEMTAPLWEALLRRERSEDTKKFGLQMRTAVSLLWLALAECDPMCRLSDLLRWARLGVVPIYSAGNELPEDVTTNWVLITRVKPSSAVEMLLVLRQVVKKLRLPPPPQPPLRQLLRRLLAELALPARLADVVANVARRASPPDTFLPEADALALLLVTLKMLLGLDDATEIRNSEVAAARNEGQPDGQRWFVFTEWLQFVRQQHAAAGEQDFQELESHDRLLQTVGGPDLCRRRHRQLLFDYYQREGTFRHTVEAPRAGKPRYFKPEYRIQTRQLFGRPEAPAAPPPSNADDLLRPVSSRLEREGGEALRQAEMWRHSQIEFLLDESHVRRLQSQGVPVAVTHAAARQRVPVTRSTPFLPRDIQLVGKRKQAIPPPELPPPRRRRPRRDLRLFMPCGEVWCVPALHGAKPTRAEYSKVATSWPASYHCLLEMLASSIELTPDQFMLYVWRAENNVLGIGRHAGAKDAKRENKRCRKRENKSDRKRKRRRASDESTTDVSSIEMELGSEMEADAEADKTRYSPDLFE